MNEDEYRERIISMMPFCRRCGGELRSANLFHVPLRNGWVIDGCEQKQRISLVCPCCGYEYILVKLDNYGIGEEDLDKMEV